MNEKKKKIISLIILISVFLLVIGGTYAGWVLIFKTSANSITSAQAEMKYKETNILNITDALPMRDSKGKIQTNYFDFTISSYVKTKANDTTGIKMNYNLVVEPLKVDNIYSSLQSSDIKVYLTKVVDGVEIQVLAPTTITRLNKYIMYSTQEEFKENRQEVNTNYRLRAWIDFNTDATNWKDLEKQPAYKFRVNVNSKVSNLLDNSGANKPELVDNMIPVYYDETNNVWKKADKNNKNKIYQWYNYDEGMWANAVTVTETNRQAYLDAPIGTVIEMEDINTMWVWVPRYKYTYFFGMACSNIPENERSIENYPDCYYSLKGDSEIKEYLISQGYPEEEVNGVVQEYKTMWDNPSTRAEIIENLKNIDDEGQFDQEAGLLFTKGFNGSNYYNRPQEIKIAFENNTASTGTINCVDDVKGLVDGVEQTTSETCTDEVNGTLIAGTSTYTHPAFNFGGTPVNGMWVGKFENSATSIPTSRDNTEHTVIIKPNVQSWRYSNVSTFFQSIRNMEKYENPYGFTQENETTYNNTGVLTGDTNNIDTHMMKNMEWGAVLYLSHSQYGKNAEITKNINSAYYTGANNYASNINQSTTGTIYGIYDMSGGSGEYVMGNMLNETGEFYLSSAGSFTPQSKYYDSYTYSASDSTYTRGKLGDATKETLSWYKEGNSSTFVNNNESWFLRNNKQFITSSYVGSSKAEASSRSVLIKTQ